MSNDKLLRHARCCCRPRLQVDNATGKLSNPRMKFLGAKAVKLFTTQVRSGTNAAQGAHRSAVASGFASACIMRQAPATIAASHPKWSLVFMYACCSKPSSRTPCCESSGSGSCSHGRALHTCPAFVPQGTTPSAKTTALHLTAPPNLQVRGQRALLALSTRPFLGYSDQGRFSLTPLSYEALEHASSFASDQCPEGLVAIVKSTLRILTVENVGEAFNQQVGRLAGRSWACTTAWLCGSAMREACACWCHACEAVSPVGAAGAAAAGQGVARLCSVAAWLASLLLDSTCW